MNRETAHIPYQPLTPLKIDTRLRRQLLEKKKEHRFLSMNPLHTKFSKSDPPLIRVAANDIYSFQSTSMASSGSPAKLPHYFLQTQE